MLDREGLSIWEHYPMIRNILTRIQGGSANILFTRMAFRNAEKAMAHIKWCRMAELPWDMA